MTTDRFEAYFWGIYALIYESDDILALSDAAFFLSDVDTASIGQTLHAVLLFRDRSRLYAEILLADEGEIVEARYAYIYYNGDGKRVVQYDNRSHHPEIWTHPHHMHKGPIPAAGEQDRAWPTDIGFVTFETVFERIRERFF